MCGVEGVTTISEMKAIRVFFRKHVRLFDVSLFGVFRGHAVFRLSSIICFGKVLKHVKLQES